MIGDNHAIGDDDGDGDESYNTNEIDDDATEEEVILLSRNDVNGQYDNHQQIDLHNCQNWRSLELDHPLGTYTQMCQFFSCLYQTHLGRFSLVQLSRQ